MSEIDQELHIDTPPEPVEAKPQRKKAAPKPATETERARAIVRAKMKK